MPGWAIKGAVGAEVIGGGPEDPLADILAGGLLVGGGAVAIWDGIQMATPPDNAFDPNGPKAPGYPGDPNTGSPDYPGDPKGGPNWVPNPNGRGYGWQDSNGNVWVPTGKGGSAHGGPHWDVQTPGGYQNVYPPLGQ